MTKGTTELEHAVIEAAAGLSTVLYLHRDWEQWHEAKVAEKATADAALSTAGRRVAEADVALAQARLRVISLEDELLAQKAAHVEICKDYNAGRVKLWTISMTNDPGTILAESQEYCSKAMRFHKSRLAIAANEAALVEAKAAVPVCAEAQRKAAEEQARAKATVEAIDQELASRPGPERAGELFKFEDALVNAAHTLTGTEEAQYAYSNVEASELLGCD